MEPVHIRYLIHLNEGRTEAFDFSLDGETFDLMKKPGADLPYWAELAYHQCSHCPLDPEEILYCPLAAQLVTLVERFHDTASIDAVEVEVITEERRVIQKLAIQQAIASMLDLIWPISGCPKTRCMKVLARFHLPLASEEETVFRVTSMYLLAQYFLRHISRTTRIELDGLSKIYEGLHQINTAIARRLRSATHSDSVKNAVTLMDMYSMLVPALLEDELAEMRPFFSAYFPEGSMEAATTDRLKKAKTFRMELASTLDIGETDSAEDDEAKRQRAIEEILSRSSVKLELVPLEEEKKAEEEAAKRKEEDDGELHIAVFKLPDD